jgi:hypothetical protein
MGTADPAVLAAHAGAARTAVHRVHATTQSGGHVHRKKSGGRDGRHYGGAGADEMLFSYYFIGF